MRERNIEKPVDVFDITSEDYPDGSWHNLTDILNVFREEIVRLKQEVAAIKMQRCLSLNDVYAAIQSEGDKRAMSSEEIRLRLEESLRKKI